MKSQVKKQDFIKLFELEKIYEEYQSKAFFIFGLHDNLTGTENAVFFIFDKNKVKVVVESEDFNEAKKKQRLELHLILKEQNIEINREEVFINELFPFLKFDTSFESSLNFIASFINKILIPKYRLMGGVTIF